MIWTIRKTFAFDAAHHLEGLEEGHKCMRVHGHTYAVTLEVVAGGLDYDGMVYDYGKLSPFRDWLNTWADHQDLNELIKQPTAENLALHFYRICRDSLHLPVNAVEVSETPETSARYGP